MQINDKIFDKFITVDLVSEICSYCSIITYCARFLSSFLQDCEAVMKYFVVMYVSFFIYNELGGETLCQEWNKSFSIKYVVYEQINIHNNEILHVRNEIFLFHVIR